MASVGASLESREVRKSFRKGYGIVKDRLVRAVDDVSTIEAGAFAVLPAPRNLAREIGSLQP